MMNLDNLFNKIENKVLGYSQKLAIYTCSCKNKIAFGCTFLGITVGSFIALLVLFILAKMCVYIITLVLLISVWTASIALALFMGWVIFYYMKAVRFERFENYEKK